MIKKRIAINPEICHGKPVIRGTRIMVWQVLDLLKDGLTFDDIITNYFPQLTKEDIKACVEYANQLVKNEEVHLVKENK
ncbi:MAG: antitoxin [Candidatus Omnitrophica bacterium 4484_70.2]|nr:MAG: antitoxin [Candidatus Omnitrophica bacterium 4484_70.2]